MPDWEFLKAIGVLAGMVFALWMIGKIVNQLVDVIRTRDKNQMERDDKRDTLAISQQTAINVLTAEAKEMRIEIKELRGEVKELRTDLSNEMTEQKSHRAKLERGLGVK